MACERSSRPGATSSWRRRTVRRAGLSGLSARDTAGTRSTPLLAHAWLGESRFAADVRKFCAQVCNSCAAACDKVSQGSIAKDCSAACRRCAEACVSVGSPVHA